MGRRRPNRGAQLEPHGLSLQPEPAERQRSIHAWFNAWLFTEPLPSPTGAFGTSGRNSIYGPSFQNLDFSMFKNFRITERQSLQFRWENFNFTNHPQFGQPNDMYSSGASYVTTPQSTFNTITTHGEQQQRHHAGDAVCPEVYFLGG